MSGRRGSLLLALACGACGSHTGPDKPMPTPHDWPPTRKDAVVDTIHGVAVADPYRWLEDGSGAEVKAWQDAQDRYSRAMLDALPDRARMRAQMHALQYLDGIGVPLRRGDRSFYTRRQADKEKRVVYWRGGDGAEHVLFDPSTWSADGTKGLADWVPSDDGTLVVYKVTENNTDEGVLHVVEVATGTVRPDTIPGARWAEPAWTPDGRGFYYTWLPEVGVYPPDERPGKAEVRYHRLGAAATADEIVFAATGNPDAYPVATPSRDGHWLTLEIEYGWNSADLLFKDLRARAATWQPLARGIDAKFTVHAWRDRFYIHTNDGAPRFRMYVADPSRPDRASWREIVAERPDATLEGFSIVGGRLALAYLHDATSQLRIHELDGTFVRDVALPAMGTAAGISGLPDDDVGYVDYSSFTEVQVIYQTSIATGAVTEYARVELPIDTSNQVTEQVWYESKDGTRVSMFLVHRKDVTPNGSVPTLLNGYGAYGFTLTPEYQPLRVAWVAAGGMYAIANLRGGGEYGEEWHRAGSLVRKQNSFDDFLAAARYLIDARWTSPRHLGIIGASNGGLLVSAAMTQAPELFGAVIALVPLSDMVRYQRFGTGAVWTSEFGSVDDPAQFAALYAYSPYHRIRDGVAYPPTLVLAADGDDRVDPMHARKLVARLQGATAGPGPVLLRLERNAGHGGSGLAAAAVDKWTDVNAFALAHLK